MGRGGCLHWSGIIYHGIKKKLSELLYDKILNYLNFRTLLINRELQRVHIMDAMPPLPPLEKMGVSFLRL